MSEPQTGEEVALLQQAYLRQLVESDSMFNNVTVLAEDDGNIESQMDKALGLVNVRDGGHGVCVIVRQPEGYDEMPGVLYSPLDLDWDIMCLEWRDVNRVTEKGGTGKRAWTLARRVLRVCKAHRAPGILQNITVRTPAIKRGSFVRELQGGMNFAIVGYTVQLRGREADDTAYDKVKLPTLSGSPALTPGPISAGSVGTVVTASCATPGAAIYYTSNLTNPCAENAMATLYTTPVTGAAGTYLFRAFATGLVGSDAVAVKFS